jgi:hypothetical protein
MDSIVVKNQQDQEKILDVSLLQELLRQLAGQEQEFNFSAAAIWEKTGQYLQIFLSGPKKTITEQQLTDLISNICRENGFIKLSLALKDHFQIPLIDFSTSGQSQPDGINMSKSVQEKMKKIFLPPSQNHLETPALIDKIAYNKTTDENGRQISRLIQLKRFLPHQNTLKGPQAFDSMQIILEDSLNDIFDQLKQAAINFQNLISTNICFSRIRQKMSIIKSTRGFSSGPVSFIKIYTSTFDTLRQNLSTNFTPEQSFVLNIHHPDILEYLIFIKNFQKHSLNKHLRFLIEITPQFLDALLKEEDFELISPENGQAVNLLSAKNTFDLIVSTIIENPQLGLKQQKQANSNRIGISGMLNLAAYSAGELEKDLPSDLKHIQEYLQKQQSGLEKLTSANLRTCLHLTGWNDLLINKKIPFGSVGAIEFATQLFSGIRSTLDKSVELSVVLNSPLLGLFEQSPGIEGIEALATLKINLDGQEIHQLHPALREFITELGIPSNEITRQIYENNSLNDLYQIPSQIKQLFCTSREIPPQFHLEIQKEAEQAIQGEVEKKIFFENSLDLEKIKDILLEKLKLGINNIGFLQFEALSKYIEDNDPENNKNFLLTLNKNKKRRHREIQPPLFQIKKTEEITLPPLNHQNQ